MYHYILVYVPSSDTTILFCHGCTRMVL